MSNKYYSNYKGLINSDIEVFGYMGSHYLDYNIISAPQNWIKLRVVVDGNDYSFNINGL